ncbi:hypothetical protein [Hymenobacter yonginensis]|uniref:Uncharacterized protein n=1 Tax=Hymenobacter yonginensis TaxID=748197 RepID=A0ABY7PMB7_9BACT|nr:hypothetical protein [Hymenobacter yonginensis]WBO83665.1 hypothetical protein O9Z63_14945 [Hymenobacter yonginensis]
MLVRPVSEPSTARTLPAIAAPQPDDWTWVMCGALFCLLLIARLAGGLHAPGAARALPPGAVAVPAATPPAPVATQNVVSRI